MKILIIVESNAKPIGFDLSSYKKLPCIINEDETNKCEVCDYKKFHDAAIGESVDGVTQSRLIDIAQHNLNNASC